MMKCAAPRVIRILLEDGQRDRCGQGLTAKPRIGGTHRAQQGQRVKNRHLVVIRPARMHRRQGVGVGDIPRELVARRVEQQLLRLQV